MVNNQLYEKIIKVRNARQKVKLISSVVLYVLYLFVWAIIGMLNPPQALLIFAFGILSCLLIFLISWKYLFLEYEYAFCMTSLTVSKIYGKRKRKPLAEIDLSKCLIISPATEESIKKADSFEPDKRIIAVSSKYADDIWLLLSDDNAQRQYLIFLESDARIYSILKTVAPHIITKKI